MRYLLLLLLFSATAARAQWKSYTLDENKDTLNRVDLKGFKQGPWIVKVADLRGERGYEEEGYFKDDKKEGVWKHFSLEGDLIALEGYSFGMKNGKSMYFTNAGEPLREESWRAIDPKNPYDTVDIRDINDPSKILRKQVVKVEPNSYKHGTWTYYGINGNIESTEQWVMNKPREEAPAADGTEDDLAPIDPNGKKATAKKDDKKPPTKPQAIVDYEKKNAGKKKIKVRDGNTGG